MNFVILLSPILKFRKRSIFSPFPNIVLTVQEKIHFCKFSFFANGNLFFFFLQMVFYLLCKTLVLSHLSSLISRLIVLNVMTTWRGNILQIQQRKSTTANCFLELTWYTFLNTWLPIGRTLVWFPPKSGLAIFPSLFFL